ncbi:MAG: hypothetical protein ACK5JE_11740 [Castellaniella sp.]|uniref:hypothetical protein n=1 Tax=Castellaniella sp. TaxID=1955812 RepID=UPI003A83E307
MNKIDNAITAFVANEIVPTMDDFAERSGCNPLEIALAVALACAGFLVSNGIDEDMLAATIKATKGSLQ